MTPLEKKKIEAEYTRVKASRLEMEVRLEELQEAIERVRKDIKIQSDREDELQIKMTNK